MAELVVLILAGAVIIDVCAAVWLYEHRHGPPRPRPGPAELRLLRELERAENESIRESLERFADAGAKPNTNPGKERIDSRWRI